MSRGSTQIVAIGLVTSVMTSSSHNISVESLQESGQLESKCHLTDDVTRLDDVIIIWGVGYKNAIFHIFHYNSTS